MYMNDTSLKHFYDALVAARAIRSFTENKTFEDYCANDLLASAVEREFEIIGEALNRIKRKCPEDINVISDWASIVGFRNILAHAYDHIEETVVWGIIIKQIPVFISELESIPGWTVSLIAKLCKSAEEKKPQSEAVLTVGSLPVTFSVRVCTIK